MIGYVLGAKQEGNTTLHRVPGSVPGWSLCGTFCSTHPKVSAQASSMFCGICTQIEAQDDDDPRGDDGPYSYIADSYMRQTEG